MSCPWFSPQFPDLTTRRKIWWTWTKLCQKPATRTKKFVANNKQREFSYNPRSANFTLPLAIVRVKLTQEKVTCNWQKAPKYKNKDSLGEFQESWKAFTKKIQEKIVDAFQNYWKIFIFSFRIINVYSILPVLFQCVSHF